MNGLILAGLLAIIVGSDSTGPTLEGVVVDSDGQPVQAARVDIATAAARVVAGRGLFCPSCYRDCVKWTLTDEQGRFAITDLDSDLRFRVLCTASGKQARLTDLTDPLDEPLTLTLENEPTELPAERTVRGMIVDDTGTPVPAALVYPEGAQTPDRRWWGQVDGVRATVSDVEGRFAMLLPENFQGIDLEITADGFAGASVGLLAPGTEEHRIEVPRGTQVTGRLVHDGQPVAGARIAVVQLDRSTDGHFIKAVEDTTDDEGQFVFDYLPADQRYAIFTPVGSGPPTALVLSTKRFSVYGNDESRDVGSLDVIPALQLAGQLILPDGQSPPPNSNLTLGRDPAWDLISVPVGEDGSFRISGLPPETYEVRVAAKGFAIDADHLPYQPLSATSFGIRLTASLDELTIPLNQATTR